jgi:uncharacterized protein YndB with AHSA1/START domain
MELISRSVRIPVNQKRVFDAITTTEGFRAWWVRDCEVGRAAGEEAVFRMADIEVVFRIDRLDARGIEMTCLRSTNFPDWEGSRLSIAAIEDGSGTKVGIRHEGLPARNAAFDATAAGWEQYANSLRLYCETGRGDPFAVKRT